ncbi:MAG TPA: PQQ-dependent sugar dehydrogenase [Anaerolineales bacterium]|nr:PQQ-dependent sugar dehydrogenase [Anaerolineales bacterium]
MFPPRKSNFPGGRRIIGFLVLLGLVQAACGLLPAGTSVPAPTRSLPPEIASATPTSLPPLPSITPTAAPTATPAPSFPDPLGYAWVPAVTGLNLPVDIQNAGDGSGRLFIVEKAGDIRIFQNGQLLPRPFLDIRYKVESDHTEQGLLGLAFHPDYSQAGVFFVNYIDLNGNTVIARFHVSADDPNRADPSSEVDLLHVQQPFANHNGGGLAFGPDGYLYIGLGDGGSAGDPLRNGQNTQTYLAKLLRIDVDSGSPYAIPPGNPFAAGGGLAEIWAYGLRNPWRFSFDRQTGDLYIADVGQDAWEEVDVVPAGTAGGLDFGWSYFEGMHSYHPNPPANVAFTKPVVEYSHANGCSITGGYVYRGTAMPAWQGVYFYGDYCSGLVWGLIHAADGSWQSQVIFNTGAQITSFGIDEAGELYMSDYRTGSVLKLTRQQ